MLLNFCHPCLRPEVSCSTISTEGYDVTNLISESSNGFLAYSCIKPPINIDLTFICNVQISRVIIWPAVGPQKSSGFQLLAKSTADSGVPYTTLSNAYLDNADSGVIFCRRDINETLTSVTHGFLHRYMKISNHRAVDKATNLRICIVKTENSVPAIGRIEVWGRVSKCCGRDVIAGVNALWNQHHGPRTPMTKMLMETPLLDDDVEAVDKSTSSLEIPEDFVDPITYEIMVQPIVLPSGKIIDQFTLERHERNEAVWGRSPSDPFTGIPFSNTSRPSIATALKARIDKFLLENSDVDEVKKLPRTLGRRRTAQLQDHAKILDVTDVITESYTKPASNTADLKASPNYVLKRRFPSSLTKNQHKLPVAITLEKQCVDSMGSKRRKCSKITKMFAASSNIQVEDNYAANISSDIDGDLELNIRSVLSGLKRFGTPTANEIPKVTKSCSCCTISVLYSLPCTHIVCRKVLTSTKTLQCKSCGVPYRTSDPKRIYTLD